MLPRARMADGEEGGMGSVGRLARTARSAITFCLGISYMVNVLLGSPLIDDLNLVLMAVVIVLSFAASTGSARTIGALLFSLSIALLVYSQAPLDIWKQALRENAYLIVMFIMVPLLGIPVQHGGYSESLRGMFARYASTGSRYYALVSIMSAFVGVLISIAAVPLTYEMSRASRHSDDKKLLSSALSRGFVTCMIWAPTSATIALVVQLTGIDWVDFFPCALACALVAGTVGFLMTLAREKTADAPSGRVEEPVGAFDARKVVELGAGALLLIASIATVSQLGGLSIIIVVAMASLVCPVVWMAIVKRLPTYVKEFKGDYFNNKLPQVKNQILLFAGAGFLAQSIGYSHVGDAMAEVLLQLTGQNVLLLTIAIIAVTLATSAAGIHPIAVVAVVGGAISASECGVTPVYLALVLSISWAMGNALSPASANVIAVSDMVGQSPIKVGLRWNGPYVLVTTTVLICVLTLSRAVGLL